MRKVIGTFNGRKVAFEATDIEMDGIKMTACEFVVNAIDGRTIRIPVAHPLKVRHGAELTTDLRVTIEQEDIDQMLKDAAPYLTRYVGVDISKPEVEAEMCSTCNDTGEVEVGMHDDLVMKKCPDC